MGFAPTVVDLILFFSFLLSLFLKVATRVPSSLRWSYSRRQEFCRVRASIGGGGGGSVFALFGDAARLQLRLVELSIRVLSCPSIFNSPRECVTEVFGRKKKKCGRWFRLIWGNRISLEMSEDGYVLITVCISMIIDGI